MDRSATTSTGASRSALIEQHPLCAQRELLAAVWRQPYGGPEKTIDVHLSWLRSKLGESARSPRYLRSVRGVGVMLVDPDAP